MATMKRSTEPDGEERKPGLTSMAGYYSKVDAIREKEFPMLQGRFTDLHVLGARDSRILQEQPILTTQAQHCAQNLSWMDSPMT